MKRSSDLCYSEHPRFRRPSNVSNVVMLTSNCPPLLPHASTGQNVTKERALLTDMIRPLHKNLEDLIKVLYVFNHNESTCLPFTYITYLKNSSISYNFGYGFQLPLCHTSLLLYCDLLLDPDNENSQHQFKGLAGKFIMDPMTCNHLELDLNSNVIILAILRQSTIPYVFTF